MTVGLLLLAALLQAEEPPPGITAARLIQAEGQTTFVLVMRGDATGVQVRRDGPRVVLTTAAVAPAGLVVPEPAGIVAAVELDRGPPTSFRLQVPEEVPFEVRSEGQICLVKFGGGPAAEAEASPPVSALYPLIFPPSGEPEAGGQVVQPVEEPEAAKDKGGGLGLGPLRIRPGLTGSLVKSRVAVTESPEPVTDTFYEIQPSLRTEVAITRGGLKVTYQPRLRLFTTFEKIREPSHLVDVNLTVPLAGPTLRFSHRFAVGVLETAEVDPGREYFFDLARFKRNDSRAGLRIETGGGLVFDAEADLNRIRFDDRSAFFDYDERSLRLGSSLELSANLRLVGRVEVNDVPPSPQRPESEGRSWRYTLSIDGEMLPLTTGHLDAGLETRKAPRAGEGGTSYHGLTLGATIAREISRDSRLTFDASRATLLSAFEANSFYVTNFYRLEYHRSLPLELTAHAGVSYRVNQYEVVSPSLAEKRRDRILALAGGAGRAITRWAFARVDYIRERRRSNAPVANLTTSTLLFQLGFGVFTP